MPGKLLILAPYPQGTAPSQRFRYEQYLPELKKAGYRIEYCSFYSPEDWRILYKKGNQLKKVWAIIKGYCKRLAHIFRAVDAVYVLLHREAAPFGPPLYEWLIARILQKKIVYDFDDAIYLGDERANRLRKLIKMPGKVAAICRWAYCVTPGNEMLAKVARQHNDNVVIMPTVVGDNYLQYKRGPVRHSSPVVVGWTGSHSTLRYIQNLVPVLRRLEQDCPVEIRVIANRDPKLPLESYRFIPWSEESEVEDLAEFDIGLMPLEDNDWTRGKCGFKAIQYLALGIPAVVSPVGANKQIVENGQNGFYASSSNEWNDRIIELIEKPQLRAELGLEGRAKIAKEYSRTRLLDIVKSIFELEN